MAAGSRGFVVEGGVFYAFERVICFTKLYVNGCTRLGATKDVAPDRALR